MAKFDLLEAALVGSASALGYNWIYDRELLNSIKDDKQLLFAPIDHELYKQAKHAFDVYPNYSVGDVDFMAEMMLVLHRYLMNTDIPTPKGFFKAVYEHISDNGPYDGYIEGYGKDLIKRYEDNDITLPTPYIDKQLIGPAIYLVIHEHFKEDRIKTGLRYAHVFTSYKHTKHFMLLFKQLLNDLDNGISMKETLQQNIKNAPASYQPSLTKALTDIDIDSFIKEYSGVACGLDQAVPLIFYILAHNDTTAAALKQNIILGGASCARGIFISALMNKVDPLKTKYKKNLKITL
ncbi:MAG: hypothetical protein UMR38_04430 [Candidatus Izemoplasma sp.]|nr:hypothetical protein [Candidatus Izemoplasma sp.]